MDRNKKEKKERRSLAFVPAALTAHWAFISPGSGGRSQGCELQRGFHAARGTQDVSDDGEGAGRLCWSKPQCHSCWNTGERNGTVEAGTGDLTEA